MNDPTQPGSAALALIARACMYERRANQHELAKLTGLDVVRVAAELKRLRMVPRGAGEWVAPRLAVYESGQLVCPLCEAQRELSPHDWPVDSTEWTGECDICHQTC